MDILFKIFDKEKYKSCSSGELKLISFVTEVFSNFEANSRMLYNIITSDSSKISTRFYKFIIRNFKREEIFAEVDDKYYIQFIKGFFFLSMNNMFKNYYDEKLLDFFETTISSFIRRKIEKCVSSKNLRQLYKIHIRFYLEYLNLEDFRFILASDGLDLLGFITTELDLISFGNYSIWEIEGFFLDNDQPLYRTELSHAIKDLILNDDFEKIEILSKLNMLQYLTFVDLQALFYNNSIKFTNHLLKIKNELQLSDILRILNVESLDPSDSNKILNLLRALNLI